MTSSAFLETCFQFQKDNFFIQLKFNDQFVTTDPKHIAYSFANYSVFNTHCLPFILIQYEYFSLRLLLSQVLKRARLLSALDVPRVFGLCSVLDD
jgi:hypothetical protein